MKVGDKVVLLEKYSYRRGYHLYPGTKGYIRKIHPNLNPYDQDFNLINVAFENNVVTDLNSYRVKIFQQNHPNTEIFK